jgi:hypothetical protein
MSYYTYGKQLLTYQNKYVSKIAATPLVSGVFNFDGSAYISVTPTHGVTDIMGNRIITWDMWLDQESGFAAYTNLMQFIPASISDSFVSNLDGSNITAVAHNINSGFQYSLAGFGNQILHIEVKKAASVITYLKINGVTQSSVGSAFSGGAASAWRIGWGTNILKKATLWNIKVYDYSMVIQESFPGQPNGDTPAAWGTGTSIVNPNNSGTRDLF